MSFDVAEGSFDVVGSLLMSVRPLTCPVGAVCHTALPWLMLVLQEGKHTKWSPCSGLAVFPCCSVGDSSVGRVVFTFFCVCRKISDHG